MNHTRKDMEINGHTVTIFEEPEPENILLQPVDSHDMEEMASEISFIEKNSSKKFVLAAIKINHWNDELSPWPAPPVFGKIPFGDGASQTLKFITDDFLPQLTATCKCSTAFLGGYSLAGLFALWSSYQTDAFKGVVAASPSVWFNGWLDYSHTHTCLTDKVYLSLGDRECHSKNKLMATVGDAIRKQKVIFDSQNIANTLEWNPGNHFQDNGERTGKGFVWVM